MAAQRKLAAVAAPQKRARRAAKPVSQPEVRRPPKLDESERDTLVFAREQLRARIADAPTHAIARLIKEFREVDRDLRMIDAKAEREADEEGEVTDDAWDDGEI